MKQYSNRDVLESRNLFEAQADLMNDFFLYQKNLKFNVESFRVWN